MNMHTPYPAPFTAGLRATAQPPSVSAFAQSGREQSVRKPSFSLKGWGQRLAAVSAAILLTTAGVMAGAVRDGFDSNVLGANDDESTGQVPIGFTINFFGASYSNLFVNNNGNVTFNSAFRGYTPEPIATAGRKIIAPFWADVDTRGVGSGLVRYAFGQGVVDGHNAFGASYVNVGYYSKGVDKLNSFQVVLIERADVAPGAFDIEFNYDKVQWETGSADTSGGIGGVGGKSVRVGYASGTGATLELQGSGDNGAYLDSNLVTGLIYNSLNSALPGRYVFQVRGGGVANLPPVANAGPDVVTAPGGAVTLDGSGSYDPESAPLTHFWQQVSGPALTLNDPSSEHPFFTADAGAYTFKLTVNDGTSTSFDFVQVNAGVPIASTRPATGVTENSAILQGLLNPAGVATDYHFEYGAAVEYGTLTPPVTTGATVGGSNVQAAISGLQPSTTYHFRLVAANDTGDDAGEDIVFTTADHTIVPPTVSITSPANGSTVTSDVVITIQATASDSDGSIARVRFFDGAVQIGEDTSSPYSQTVNGLSVGEHTLTAVAVDNDSATTQSAPVTIQVGAAEVPPTVAITSPADGSELAPGTQVINASASDTDGSIVRVRFFDGATLLGEDTTFPYSQTVAGFALGEHELTAVAEDDDGLIRQSAAVTILVAVPNVPPTIALTANDTTLTEIDPIVLTANAVDTDGTIVGVEFFIGEESLGIQTEAPYVLNVGALPTGAYTYTASVTDDRSAVVTSAPVTVIVGEATPVANDDNAFAITQVKIDPRRNDEGPAGLPLTVTAVGGSPTKGRIAISNSGTRVTYTSTAALAANESDSFTYTVTNSIGRSSTATVTVYPAPATGSQVVSFLRDQNGEAIGMVTYYFIRTGLFTGVVNYNGKRYGFRGGISGESPDVIQVARGTSPSLPLTFGVGPAQAGSFTIASAVDAPSGTEEWSGNAQRSPYSFLNNTALLGRYTVSLRPDPLAVGNPSLPQGGAGLTMAVTRTGSVRYSGRAADGTVISGGSYVLNGDTVPIYSLSGSASRRGRIAGTIAFQSGPQPELAGGVEWKMPASATSPLYPAGFTVDMPAIGCRYTPPLTQNAMLPFGAGAVADFVFTGAGLSAPLSGSVIMGTFVKASPLPPINLARFSYRSGFYLGRVTNPDTLTSQSFFGVVLQHTSLNTGEGSLVGKTGIGSAILTP